MMVWSLRLLLLLRSIEDPRVEVLVVDCGSTDNSVQEARSAGAKVERSRAWALGGLADLFETPPCHVLYLMAWGCCMVCGMRRSLHRNEAGAGS